MSSADIRKSINFVESFYGHPPKIVYIFDIPGGDDNEHIRHEIRTKIKEKNGGRMLQKSVYMCVLDESNKQALDLELIEICDEIKDEIQQANYEQENEKSYGIIAIIEGNIECIYPPK